MFHFCQLQGLAPESFFLRFPVFDQLLSFRPIVAHVVARSLDVHHVAVVQQQIQRYEAESYASASYRRLCQVAQALDVRVENVKLIVR